MGLLVKQMFFPKVAYASTGLSIEFIQTWTRSAHRHNFHLLQNVNQQELRSLKVNFISCFAIRQTSLNFQTEVLQSYDQSQVQTSLKNKTKMRIQVNESRKYRAVVELCDTCTLNYLNTTCTLQHTCILQLNLIILSACIYMYGIFIFFFLFVPSPSIPDVTGMHPTHQYACSLCKKFAYTVY